MLSRLGEVLVDIHSQHQTLSLSDTAFQFEIIDAMAENKSLLEEYQRLLVLLKNEQKKLQELIDFQQTTQRTEIGYFRRRHFGGIGRKL